MVVRSSGERKKVNPRGEVSLANDDLIELIPGHHFFKLVLPRESERGSYERAAKKARKVTYLTKEWIFIFCKLCFDVVNLF